MHVHRLVVHGHKIRCDDRVFVAGSMGHDAIQLELSAEWHGLSIVIALGSDADVSLIAWDGEPIVVPSSHIAVPGFLPVGISGYADEGKVRVLTAEADRLFRVVRSGPYEGGDPYPDQPDLLGQLLDAARNANDAADKLLEMAESGQFDGKDGSTYTIGHGIRLDGDVISVDMAEGIEQDNTLPVSSADVYTTVGNIDAILHTI